jgi:pilus assembly protein CpaB
MKLKWAIVALVILGLLAALSAALLVKALSSQKMPGKVRAVIATREIPARSWLTSQYVEVKEVPRAGLAEGYFSDPTQVIGKVVAVTVPKDKVLTRSDLMSEGGGAQLAATLPYGKRAVSVPVSRHSVMGGLLYPGCAVDVIATFRLRSRETEGEAISTTLLHNVQVLAVQDESIVSSSSEAEKKAKGPADNSIRDLTVTLMVDTRQAEALQIAMDNGKITLAMRNPLDQRAVDTEPMVLSQGKLARLGELLGPSVFASPSGPIGGDMNNPAAMSDPNMALAALEQGGVNAQGLERFFGYEGGLNRRNPQWQVTVIRGREVKEEILQMGEGGAVGGEPSGGKTE